ncbi:MAG: hypothetical protein FD153_955 [Rhodospirillaceae bacterium]|nr:MAG: hypothetical protein FD153_955 [Rhodospirillaceae bacterium]
MPSQFSWVDHRLIRDEWLVGCTPSAWALYLFLVTVSDFEGLSYYSDHALAQRLGLNEEEVRTARGQLLRADLIAYETPLCQVLSLEPEALRGTVRSGQRAPVAGTAVSIGEVLGALIGGAR